MAEVFDEWLNMWELTQRFWEMAKIFGKWLRYMMHG